jgi:hypothetical protein
MNKNSLKQMIVAEMILADIGEGRSESPKKRSLFEMMDDSYLAELDDSKFAHSMESVGDLFEDVPKDNWKVTDPKTGEKRAPKTSGPRSEKQQAAADAAKAAWKATKAAAAPTADADSNPPASSPQDNDEPLPTDPTNPATPMHVPTADVDSGGDDSDGGGSIAVPTPQTPVQLPSTDVSPPVEIVGDQPPPEKDEPVDVNFTETDTDDRPPETGAGDSAGREDSGDSDPANPSSGLAYLNSLAQKEINAAQGAPDPDVKSESRLSLIDLLYDA